MTSNNYFFGFKTLTINHDTVNATRVAPQVSLAAQNFATNRTPRLARMDLEVRIQRGIVLEHFATCWAFKLRLCIS
jgi:hypothetical protein